MDKDILIKNGRLITMEEDTPFIEKGAVFIKKGFIESVGTLSSLSAVKADIVIDATSKIIMPGLVNAHTHLPMSMFRGLADDLPLDEWLNEHIFPAEAAHVNPESVKKWTLHSCKEMLLSGTTTCCDGYFHEDQAVQAVIQSGIRAVMGQGIIDFPAPGVPDPSDNVNHAIDFVLKFKKKSSLVYPSIFCHSPYTCSKETLIAAKKAAVSNNVLFQIHVAETKNESAMITELGGRSIVRYLDDIGILDEQTLIVHGVWIDNEDILILKKRSCSVVHCPESNMKLASGVAPVPKMLDNNIRVGLGTDGCASNNDLDLFSEMDMAAKLHKVIHHDPCVMDARTVIKMATIDGAKAIGLGKITGSIRQGKRADIILVDIDKPHLIPMYDPFSALVYSAKSSDVDTVMVDGKILVQNGRYLSS